MKRSSDEVKLRTIKVSQKGQITIPVDIQRDLGIKKGDEVLLVKKGEKPARFKKAIEADFSDITRVAELALRKMWSQSGDDVWDEYLKKQ